jgi:hypothetical protein
MTSNAVDAFDWSNDPAVILQRREPVAAYVNVAGEICIRQQRWPQDDDAVICIPQQDAEYFASRIAGLAHAPSPKKPQDNGASRNDR